MHIYSRASEQIFVQIHFLSSELIHENTVSRLTYVFQLMLLKLIV